MPTLFVPEEQWGPRSWAINHPLTVAAQIHHGLVDARYGYWGFSPSNIPEGGYDAYGVDAHRHEPGRLPIERGQHLRRSWLRRLPGREPKPDPPPSAYTNGVVTPHAAFLALRWAPNAALANLAKLAGRLRDLRQVGLPRLGQRRHRRRLRLLPVARPGHHHGRDRQRAWPRHAARRVRDARSSASALRAGHRHGDVQRRPGPRRRLDCDPRPCRDSARPQSAPDRLVRRARRRRPSAIGPAPDVVAAAAGRCPGDGGPRPGDGRLAAGRRRGRLPRPSRPTRRRAVAPIDHRARRPPRGARTGPYVDTTGEPGTAAWYAVASVATIDAPVGPLSEPVERRLPRPEPGAATVDIEVDAADRRGPVQRPWRPIIGSEHLALLLRGEGPGGRDVGDELAAAFRIVRAELGAQIRPGARDPPRQPGRLPRGRRPAGPRLRAGRRRPRAPARRPGCGRSSSCRSCPATSPPIPTQTVFDYRGIISPPRDMDRWSALVARPRRAISSSASAPTRSGTGRSRSGTSRTCGSSGRPTRRPTSTCTTPPSGP